MSESVCPRILFSVYNTTTNRNKNVFIGISPISPCTKSLLFVSLAVSRWPEAFPLASTCNRNLTRYWYLIYFPLLWTNKYQFYKFRLFFVKLKYYLFGRENLFCLWNLLIIICIDCLLDCAFCCSNYEAHEWRSRWLDRSDGETLCWRALLGGTDRQHWQHRNDGLRLKNFFIIKLYIRFH